MIVRINKLASMVRLAAIGSLVLLVGAGRPIRSNAAAAIAPKPAAAVLPKARPAPAIELLHDIPTPVTPATPKLRKIRMEVTAYCPCKKCCGENAQGITASGLDISYNQGRFVAADTDQLPFGTKLIIPGYAAGPVEVIDRGGAIKGNKLDVFFPTHEEALQWGRQWVEVTIVE